MSASGDEASAGAGARAYDGGAAIGGREVGGVLASGGDRGGEGRDRAAGSDGTDSVVNCEMAAGADCEHAAMCFRGEAAEGGEEAGAAAAATAAGRDLAADLAALQGDTEMFIAAAMEADASRGHIAGRQLKATRAATARATRAAALVVLSLGGVVRLRIVDSPLPPHPQANQRHSPDVGLLRSDVPPGVSSAGGSDGGGGDIPYGQTVSSGGDSVCGLAVAFWLAKGKTEAVPWECVEVLDLPGFPGSSSVSRGSPRLALGPGQSLSRMPSFTPSVGMVPDPG